MTLQSNASLREVFDEFERIKNNTRIIGNPELAIKTAKYSNGDIAVYAQKGYFNKQSQLRVTSSQLQSIETNLKVENIKEGVNIFGLTGSLKELPTGWDNIKNGEVFGGNILKNDAVAWKQYGNWDNTLNTVEHTMDADITWIDSTAISGDGRFIALGHNQYPSRLTVYRIDKDVPVKLPNPHVSLTEKPIFMKFSKNGNMLIGMTDAGRFFNYKIENDTTLVNIPSPKLLQTTNVAHATGKLDISNDGRLLAGEYKDYRGYTQRFIYERDIDSDNWVERYSISTSGIDEIYIPCIHPSNNFVCFVYRDKYSLFFKRNTRGGFSDVRNNSYIYGSNFYWNTDGSMALATVKSTERNKIQLIKCDVNSTTNDYMTQDSTYTLSYNADFLCVNPDFSHFLSLGTSTTFKIYKITMDNGEFGIIDTGKTIPFVSASTLSRKVEFGGDYLLVSKGSYVDLYRTVSKNIVTPLTKVHNGTFKTCEVGFALTSGTVGQNVKVNTFPKLKL